jgi:mRNA-degrading endonuclease RelE of RelBE toxin-antitoxin system
VLQITFNEISARELSSLPQDLQLQLMEEFQIAEDDIDKVQAGEDERFGVIEREGKRIFRFRASEYRIYFEIEDDHIVVHRVLHRNTVNDFLYRTRLPTGTPGGMTASPEFWELIEEGERAGGRKNSEQ